MICAAVADGAPAGGGTAPGGTSLTGGAAGAPAPDTGGVLGAAGEVGGVVRAAACGTAPGTGGGPARGGRFNGGPPPRPPTRGPGTPAGVGLARLRGSPVTPLRAVVLSCLTSPASRLDSPARSRRKVCTLREVNVGALWPPTSRLAPIALFSTDRSRTISPS